MRRQRFAHLVLGPPFVAEDRFRPDETGDAYWAGGNLVVQHTFLGRHLSRPGSDLTLCGSREVAEKPCGKCGYVAGKNKLTEAGR